MEKTVSEINTTQLVRELRLTRIFCMIFSMLTLCLIVGIIILFVNLQPVYEFMHKAQPVVEQLSELDVEKISGTLEQKNSTEESVDWQQVSDAIGSVDWKQVSDAIGSVDWKQISDSVGSVDWKQISDSVGSVDWKQISDSIGSVDWKQVSDTLGQLDVEAINTAIEGLDTKELSEAIENLNQAAAVLESWGERLSSLF